MVAQSLSARQQDVRVILLELLVLLCEGMPITWHLRHSLIKPLQGGSNKVIQNRCLYIYACIFGLINRFIKVRGK